MCSLLVIGAGEDGLWCSWGQERLGVWMESRESPEWLRLRLRFCWVDLGLAGLASVQKAGRGSLDGRGVMPARCSAVEEGGEEKSVDRETGGKM